MNSHNHYAYGAVAGWICRYAAGSDTTSSDSGFRNISLHPNFNAGLGGVNFPLNLGCERSRRRGIGWMASHSRAAASFIAPANEMEARVSNSRGDIHLE